MKELRSIGGFASPLPGTSTPVPTPYSDPSLLESETDRSFSQSTLQQTAQQRLLHNPNETAIAQREQEIEEIAQGIIELANIFQDLQTMVIDQGSMLDRIDYNVEKMATEVKAADKELTVATGYQKKTVKRKAILLLLIVIFGIIILVGLKFSGKDRNPSPIPSEPEHASMEGNAPPRLIRRTTDSLVSHYQPRPLGRNRRLERRKLYY